MTKEEYKLLPSDAQEAFITEGGVFTPSLPDLQQVVESRSSSPSVVSFLPPDVILPSDTLPAASFPERDSVDTVTTQGSSADTSVQETNFDGFAIENPVELLFMLDKDIASGRVTLHFWQYQILMDFARNCWKDTHPFQAVVRACNGSGKDKYIIAPCAVWLAMRYRKTIAPITSASGVQLDRQTCRYIKELCESANRKFGIEVWTINYRHYKCNFGNGDISELFCFATDEKGKAEGYHPTAYGARMAIFVSEDKTVADDINEALNKCTGYTHRLHASTPGLPMGHFYDYCSTAVDRKMVPDVTVVEAIDWVQYLVKGTDCSHLSKAYFEQMKRDLPGGEFGAAYKSQVEAEFSTTDEMVVIPYTYIWWATHNVPKKGWLRETYNTAGLDLSDGGDETVLVVRNGNKHLATIPFKFDNTEDTIEFLCEKFKEWSLDHPEALIFADAGGLGKPMLNRMVRLGWRNIRFIDNRNTPFYPQTYKNRGAELWFHIRLLFERHELIVKDDASCILSKQLGGRYYKLLGANIHQLLSKMEQKSKGYKSPDRADAFTLAFWNYKSTFVETGEDAPVYATAPYEQEAEEAQCKSELSLRSWANSRNKFNVENKQTDFSYLQDEIASHNRFKQSTTKV